MTIQCYGIDVDISWQPAGPAYYFKLDGTRVDTSVEEGWWVHGKDKHGLLNLFVRKAVDIPEQVRLGLLVLRREGVGA